MLLTLEQDVKSLTLDNQHLTTEGEDLKSKILMLQGNISQFEEKLAKETVTRCQDVGCSSMTLLDSEKKKLASRN